MCSSDLRSSLNSNNPDELVSALRKLALLDAPEVVPDIILLLKNSNPRVLCAACQALAVLGNKETIPSIEPLLNLPASSVKSEEAKFLQVFSVASWVRSSPVEVVREEAQKAIATLRAKP